MGHTVQWIGLPVGITRRVHGPVLLYAVHWCPLSPSTKIAEIMRCFNTIMFWDQILNNWSAKYLSWHFQDLPEGDG